MNEVDILREKIKALFELLTEAEKAEVILMCEKILKEA